MKDIKVNYNYYSLKVNQSLYVITLDKKTSVEELLPPIKVLISVDFAFRYVCKSNQSGQFNLLGVRA